MTWTGRLSVRLPEVTVKARDAGGDSESTPRQVWFDVADSDRARVFRGDQIKVGQEIAGPAIIEEATTTIVLPENCTATLTGNDNFVIDLAPETSTD